LRQQRDPRDIKDDYSKAIHWLVEGVCKLKAICFQATKHIDAPVAEQKAIDPFLMLYQSALQQKKLLNILSDYLPRYLMSLDIAAENNALAAWHPETAASRANARLFFEELTEALPHIEESGLRALAKIRST
jgi:hypothetical protein